MKLLRIATRASALARAQAQRAATRIERALGCETTLCFIQTSGDRAPHAHAGKALFVKELERALLAGDADLAVHSAKDLPSVLAPGCVLAAFPERADPRDALLTREPGARLATLPRGARVGTGSARRASQVRAARPDLRVVALRGNVDTRLARLDAGGELDALLLACAGLERLGVAARIGERIAPEQMLPAVAQGTLALETRAGSPVARALRAVDDADVRACATAERAFLQALGGDCSAPLAAFAELRGENRLRLRALVAQPDGGACARADIEARADEPEQAGARAADAVRAAGGDEILAALQTFNASRN